MSGKNWLTKISDPQIEHKVYTPKSQLSEIVLKNWKKGYKLRKKLDRNGMGDGEIQCFGKSYQSVIVQYVTVLDTQENLVHIVVGVENLDISKLSVLKNHGKERDYLDQENLEFLSMKVKSGKKNS